MSEQPPFIRLMMDGYVDADDINNFIDYWHDSDLTCELHDFLGLSWEEYTLYLSDASGLATIVKARRDRVPLVEAVNDNVRYQERIAARSDDAGKISALTRWIAAQSDR